jgi:hypothetical protein
LKVSIFKNTFLAWLWVDYGANIFGFITQVNENLKKTLIITVWWLNGEARRWSWRYLHGIKV